MNIAICDDNPLELKKIAAIVEDYASGSGLPVSFQTFSDAQSMLSAAKKEYFSHYLLVTIGKQLIPRKGTELKDPAITAFPFSSGLIPKPSIIINVTNLFFILLLTFL